MNIPDCYDPFRQAEQLAAARDKLEAQMVRCGGCGRIIEPGERCWQVPLRSKSYLICRSCKEDVLESEIILEGDDYV